VALAVYVCRQGRESLIEFIYGLLAEQQIRRCTAEGYSNRQLLADKDSVLGEVIVICPAFMAESTGLNRSLAQFNVLSSESRYPAPMLKGIVNLFVRVEINFASGVILKIVWSFVQPLL
jgi:hypothetical protein